MERLITPFGEKLNKDLPLNDYPRPQMARSSFFNLNGRWEYAIYPKDEGFKGYQGEIIVPFSPESILSGVEKVVTENDVLYYHRKFTFVKENDRALLHFGAVDYLSEVILNGVSVGKNRGGYFPFSFDVTEEIKEGENDLEVIVTDPTDKGTQARGKQSNKRGGIWYTPQSGIWQTVWLEQVPENYIAKIVLTPDIDKDELKVVIDFSDEKAVAELEVFDGEKSVAAVTAENGEAIIKLSSYECWSPENPKLYDLVIKTGKDEVKSYFGMRKFGIGKDENGISRLMLNNKPYFHNGLLDQGYWSDGLYTAPSDEALIYDIETMKKMGFNMLRKHIKIEPLRWYYHCDRLGMLVWQDMISGGGIYKAPAIMIVPAFNMAFGTKAFMKDDTEKNYAFFSREDEQGRKEYYEDSARMVDELYNVVSLAVWVPFNEGWGQFDSAKAYEFYRKLDSTRSIDHASGWHDQGAGDFNSFHIYFTPYWFPKYDKNDDRPIILSEYGGFSLKVPGHMYNKEKFFGYRKYYEQEKFNKALFALIGKRVKRAIKKGLSATVYTEVSDVEDECNGLLSFDRRLVKTDVEALRKINETIKL